MDTVLLEMDFTFEELPMANYISHIEERQTEGKESLKNLLVNMQKHFESCILTVNRQLEEHKSGENVITNQDLNSLHEKISVLKRSWLALIKNAPKDILLIDHNASFVRILQNKIADMLLEQGATPVESFLKNILNGTEEQFQTLTALYQQHFSHIENPIHKKQIMIKLSNFYDNDYAKTVDWSFFKELPFDEASRRLDVLISTKEDPDFDLVNFFQQSKQQIDALGSDPYLTLVAVRYHQKRAGNVPYVFDEAIQFLAQLCTKNIERRGVKTYEYALSLWAKLLPHQCAHLSKLQKYNENTLLALLKFSDVRLISSLNFYIDFAINSLNAINDGEESAIIVRSFPAFVHMQRKVTDFFRFSKQQLENDDFILNVIQQFPSFSDVITYVYLKFVQQGILPTADNINVPTAIRLVFEKVGINAPNLIFQAYTDHVANFMADLLEEYQLSNAAHTFGGLLKFFPYAVKGIGIGVTHDGKDDDLLLEVYSKLRTMTESHERLKIIHEKTIEYFTEEKLETLKCHEIYAIYFIVHKLYQEPEQFDALWQKFKNVDTTNFTPCEKAKVLEWIYDGGEISAPMKKYLSLLLTLKFSLTDALQVLGVYQKSSVEFSDNLYDRFLKINPFPSKADEKLQLALYLPHVCDERFQTILDHPVLQSTLSYAPLAHLVTMAATMDTAQSQQWLDKNESYKREKSLWDQWLENPFDTDFYRSYVVHIMQSS
ncbi:MAG: hypothetical protein NEHIOOID_00189 [Holosporales bacterium]